MKRTPNWLDKQALLLLHGESLTAFGGARGLRDEGLLDSALDRARNQFLYDPDVDLAAMAAAYGFGLAKNHPFVDGNKRAAFLGLGLFLAINGKRLRVEQLDAIATILALAAGEITEAQLTEWIRANIRRR
ncbi:MAG: type II toxin-antitoxin system death-on-curing family toxin [Steroidobacteraceae bacterium]|nr:type II toxin-antitoxin system death-on-curing family toxin [Steroidobacteraceae bacterium]